MDADPGVVTAQLLALVQLGLPARRAWTSLFAIAAIGSFFAGCVGTLILAAFAAPLTEVAFKFGPAEYFSLMVLGLTILSFLTQGSMAKALLMAAVGVLVGLVMIGFGAALTRRRA